MNYLDMLTRLGVGSAHPGGFTATLEQLKKHPIQPGSRVLEVGCGTGRTSCYLAAQGVQVTGVDIRPGMIEKARLRAEKEQVNVDFLVGDVCMLPFADNSFNAVLGESITIFAGIDEPLKEYYRVLRQGGKLYDREIIAWKPLSASVSREVGEYYGVAKLYNAEEWTGVLRKIGFDRIEFGEKSVFPQDMWQDEAAHPDLAQVTDPDAYLDPDFWEVANRYAEIMFDYGDYFGYALMIAEK